MLVSTNFILGEYLYNTVNTTLKICFLRLDLVCMLRKLDSLPQFQQFQGKFQQVHMYKSLKDRDLVFSTSLPKGEMSYLRLVQCKCLEEIVLKCLLILQVMFRTIQQDSCLINMTSTSLRGTKNPRNLTHDIPNTGRALFVLV